MTNFEIDQMSYEAAISQGFTPVSAKFVVAQGRLESGHYTSNAYKNNNNSFGMKYVGQPLATRGTIAPYSERSNSCKVSNNCSNSDYYAKYNNVSDSIKDVTGRLYNITMGGVTPEQLKNSKTPEEYAHLLKLRRYYGATEQDYASTIKSILNRLKLVEVYELLKKNKTPIKYGLIGASIIAMGGYFYFLVKKGVIKF